jgi:hypothetical protein
MESVELLPGVMMVLAKSVRSFEEEHLGAIISGHVLVLLGNVVVIPFGVWDPILLCATLNRNFLFAGPLLMSYTLLGVVLKAFGDDERMEKSFHLMHPDEQFNLV